MTENNIKLIKQYRMILEEYYNLLKKMGFNNSINIDPIVKSKKFSEYKNFYNSLDESTESNIFLILEDLIYSVPKKINFNKQNIFSLSGTYLKVTTQGKIKCVSSITVPPFNRDSSDFIYLHEGVLSLYFQLRIGKCNNFNENIEVFPHFYELYALDKLKDNYSERTKNYILNYYIRGVKYYIIYIFYELNNFDEVYKNKDVNFIKKWEKNICYAFQKVSGLIKAISLYVSYIKNNIDIESINNALLDNSKSIGEEFDYSLYDLDNEENFKIYKNFLQEYKYVLKK